MFRISIVLFFIISSVTCQNTTLLSRAKIPDPEGYFTELMQETMLEMERKGWSTLKLVDFTTNITLQMYDWLVSGTVTYKNGFLVSIQSIDVTGIQTFITTRNENTIATISGYLNLHNVELGYDVEANLTDGIHHYTGTFTHDIIQYNCIIEKNINLNTTSTTIYMSSLSGGLHRMYYMPIDGLSDVLSREYKPYLNWDGVQPWGEVTFVQIMGDVANTKKPFPDFCFNQC